MHVFVTIKCHICGYTSSVPMLCVSAVELSQCVHVRTRRCIECRCRKLNISGKLHGWGYKVVEEVLASSEEGGVIMKW